MKTKNIIKFTIILLLLNGITACDKKEKDKCEPFVLIGQGSLHGNGSEGIPEQNIVISTQEEWEILMTTIGENEVKYFSETEIDFDEYQIIAAFDKVRGQGGWSIDITCITEYSDKIVATVLVKNNNKVVAPTVITQPYHIVKVPISMKRIDFK